MGMINVLNEWIVEEDYDEKETLYPCWASIIYIIADELGGRHPAYSRIIARDFEGNDKMSY
jgi:hypothetical protein